MRRLCCAPRAIAAAVVLLAGTLAMEVTPAAASSRPGLCGQGRVVGEQLSAPVSSPPGSPFTVNIVLRNCTGTAQSIALEGRLTPPPNCTGPVIDPLPLTLSPHQRFTTSYVLQTQSSCHGKYAVQVSVVQGSVVLARHTTVTTIT